MKRSVRRWLSGAGALTAVGALGSAGALTLGQGAAEASFVPARIATPSQAVPPRPAPPYVPPRKALFFGESGAAVRSVQRRLNQLHYFAGPADGVYGQDLITAAWAFREVQGLAMNATTGAEPITRAFEKDLINPRAPKVLDAKGGGTRVEVNLKIQVLVLYKASQPSLILHISSAGGYYFCDPPPPKSDGQCSYAVTPDGNFHAVYMIPGLDKVPLGYMYNPVFFDPAAGDAIHGGDPDPWYPASHGCVRLPADAQDWFWKELTIGGTHATPVFIRGVAPYILGPG
jgi:peptidoglycan hydrolase-like protein with peptidoglycan-binding domain